ncbi:hypothetical protein ABW21_db0203786 [Orbilia brochopaga]|nr:hypothetical protein ABW21_db0203786 [Drechslerella brochopaga]
MTFSIHPASGTDADALVRIGRSPEPTPFRKLMYPNSTLESRESEIQWEANWLRAAMLKRDATFCKVCIDDGTPIAYAGWIVCRLESRRAVDCYHEPTEPDPYSLDNIRPEDIPNFHLRPVREFWDALPNPVRRNPDPLTLDRITLAGIMTTMRIEIERILHGRETVWLDPAYKGKRIESMLLRWGCNNADTNGRDQFVMAPLFDEKLYRSFGFKVEGEVIIPNVHFKSMYRKARELSAGKLHMKAPVPQVDIKTEDDTQQDDIKIEDETQQDCIQLEDEIKQEYIKLEDEIKQDYIQTEDEPQQEYIKPEDDTEQDYIKTEDDTEQDYIKPEDETQQDHVKPEPED